MKTQKLKACPFCGKLPTTQPPMRASNGEMSQLAKVMCKSCRFDRWGYTIEEAIFKWNDRAGDREPATSKAAEDKHVGISDGLGGYNVSTVIKKYPDARCKKSASGKHFIVESVGSTIGKGPTPQAAWNDAASICDSNLKELIEWAWGIIANAGGGDWEKESAEWREAAKKWRDEYHETLNPPNAKLTDAASEASSEAGITD